MKLKLSHKDYLLALGILVAAIIMVTTLVYSDAIAPASKRSENTTPHKTTGFTISPSVLFKKVVEQVDLKSLTRKH